MKIIKKNIKGKISYEVKGYLGSYIDLNGNVKQKNFHRTFNSSAEAKTAFNKAKIAFQKQSNQLSVSDFNNHPTFQQVYESWMETYQQGVKGSTLNHVLVLFNHHILPLLGKKQVDKITWQDCQRAALKWKEDLKGYNKTIIYSSMVFKRALKLGLIPSNPMELIDIPKQHSEILDNDKHNYWNLEQLKIFLNAISQEDEGKRFDRKAFFCLMATTGMRKGEVLGMTWENIDIQKRFVTVKQTVARDVNNRQIISTPKTINAYRSLRLDDTTIDALQRHKKHLPMVPNAKDLVFQKNGGGMLSLMTPNHWMNYFIKKTGLPHISVHGLRHTFASIQITHKINPKAVQMQLGHSDAETTLNIYSHMEREQVSSEIFDIGNII